MTYMQQRFWSTRIALSAIVILLLLCIAPTAALGVLGAKYTGSIAPGGKDTHVMTIEIGADESPTDVMVEVAGFGQNANGIYVPLDPATDVSPYSARSFITLDNTTLHLEPGTEQSVTATISLPQDTGPGGRYAILYVRSIPGAGQSLATAVVVPMFITVAGTKPTETGSITQIGTGTVAIGQPITITTTFKNTGNYHYYSASDEVTVSDSNGIIVANTSTTPMAYAIIPGNTVQFVTQPQVKNLQAGTYTVNSTVLLNGQVLDQKSTTFTVTATVPPTTESGEAVSPVGQVTSAGAGSPTSVPTKASMPSVLSIVALAATAIIVGGAVRQRK